MTRTEREPRIRYVIELEAVRREWPSIHGLKRFLKLIGRYYGLKCTGGRELVEEEASVSPSHPESQRPVNDRREAS